MKQQVELLAPAGSPEAFYGAINAGADAVYLAGNQYGARAYADNFSREELISCLRYAHVFSKKIYLTVNTLVKEKELEALPDFLRPFAEEGLDGVIVQDLGAACIIKDAFPKLPLHASTQMSITGVRGADFLRELGFVRIVPARELSLREIRTLKKNSGMEMECFIHGAMCYCYSGQCLFSSMLGGRSGNRGRCAQPCRLPYRIVRGDATGKECYPLSLKDMCTLEILPELIDAGIDSFKIEGRMKKPEYAAGVTSFYRKYIDRYYEGKDCHVSGNDLKQLASLYLRSGRGTGYYHQRNGKEMITLQNPAYVASDEVLLEKIRQEYLVSRKKLPVCMSMTLRLGAPATLWMALANDPSTGVCIEGPAPEAARKAPITKENIQKQLGKLGDCMFSLEEGNLALDVDENIFYSLKSLNDLRREAATKLEEVILS